MRFLSDVGKAVVQFRDPAFQSVFWRGMGLTFVLLAAFGAALVWGLNLLLPDEIALPFLGEVGWVDDIASGASILGLLVLSVFLMVPVASAVIGFFLDDVTDAVERRHYPHLPPAPSLSVTDAVRDGLAFFGVLVLANIAAFALYLAFAPFAPFIFLAMNGFLLGREYFQLVAARRLGRSGAAALRRRYAIHIWAAGCLMALPLTVPVVNLAVPLLGAAAFTHLYHRLPIPAATSARTSRYRARRSSPRG